MHTCDCTLPVMPAGAVAVRPMALQVEGNAATLGTERQRVHRWVLTALLLLLVLLVSVVMLHAGRGTGSSL